jgi:hypothetical protein
MNIALKVGTAIGVGGAVAAATMGPTTPVADVAGTASIAVAVACVAVGYLPRRGSRDVSRSPVRAEIES